MAQESNKHFVQTEKPALLSEDREVRDARRQRPQTGWDLPAGRRWCQQHLGADNGARGRDRVQLGQRHGAAGTLETLRGFRA